MNNTYYVRPGTTLLLPSSCGVIFGSGSGSCKLRTTGTRVRSVKTEDNGFLSWVYDKVTLTTGQEAIVDEWYHPGGASTKHYIADLEEWQCQRRARFLSFLIERQERQERQEREEARERELLALMRKAYGREAQMCIYSSWVCECALGINRGGRYSYRQPRWELSGNPILQRVKPPPGLEKVHERLLRYVSTKGAR